MALYRPFWYDELVTWHVARMPTLAAIWDALHDGVDQSLPLTHLPVRLSHALFGYSTLATRLPALVGFWFALLSMYLFLKRRFPAPYALIGMVFPMLTFAWGYAFEARAYGILLGAAGLALVSWQSAAEGRRRTLSLIGITLCLAASLASNYAGVLVAVPFALGEVVRTLDRRKLDLPVWIAFAAAAPVTLIYPSLLAATRDWDLRGMLPDVTTFSGFYATVLKPAITPLLLGCVAAFVFARNRKDQPPAPALRSHETAALVGFVLAPMVFIAAGILSRHMLFMPRYGIISVIGMAGCFTALLYRVTSGNWRSGAAALFILVAWLAASRTKDAIHAIGDPEERFEQENPVLVQAAHAGPPVLVTNALLFIAADFYLPPTLSERLHYPIYPQPASGRDCNDHLMSAAARDLPIHAKVDSWSDFAARRQPFLLYADALQSQWLSELLIRMGWRVTLRAQQGDQLLFDVTPPV
jgi:hypothetical protein